MLGFRIIFIFSSRQLIRHCAIISFFIDIISLRLIFAVFFFRHFDFFLSFLS
jgi:hypothetical protein